VIVSAAAYKLAGFVLLHALWIASDLPSDEVLVPFAICEGSEGRRLVHFEADTQAQAIENGKSFISSPPQEFVRCAFARDGRAQTAAGYRDVISVSIFERGSDKQPIVHQFYSVEQNSLGLLGPIRTSEEEVSSQPGLEGLLPTMEAGMRDHPEAFSLWESWKKSVEPLPAFAPLDGDQ
jgi:hypothetical protein